MAHENGDTDNINNYLFNFLDTPVRYSKAVKIEIRIQEILIITLITILKVLSFIFLIVNFHYYVTFNFI